MKLRTFLLSVLFTLVTTGCGSDSPKEIAKQFVQQLSIADYANASKLVDESGQKKLESVKGFCAADASTALAKEVFSTIKTLEHCSYGTKKSEIEKNRQEALKNIEGSLKKFQKEITEKYGDVRRLPTEKKKELANNAIWDIVVPAASPLIRTMIQSCNISSPHEKDIASIIASYFPMMKNNLHTNRRSYMAIENLSKAYLLRGKSETNPFTRQCVDHYTDFGFVEESKVIEMKQPSPDKAEIRLELSLKNGKAKKTVLKLENIKDRWLVSDFPLNESAVMDQLFN